MNIPAYFNEKGSIPAILLVLLGITALGSAVVILTKPIVTPQPDEDNPSGKTKAVELPPNSPVFDEVSEVVYTILDSDKYVLLDSDAKQTIDSELKVKEDTEFSKDVTIGDDLELKGTLTVDDDIQLEGELSDKDSDTLKIDDKLNVTGQKISSSGGDLILDDNVDLGSGTSSTVSVVGRFDTHLLPSTTGARDLGSTTLAFRNLFLTGNVTIPGTTTLNTVAYTWPSADGAASQYLQTDGSGTLSWAAATAGTLQAAYEAGNSIQLSAAQGDIRIYNDASAEMMFFDESTGNIGIGNTSPSFNLHVQNSTNANLALEGGTNYDPALYFRENGNSTHYIYSDGSVANNPLNFYDFAFGSTAMTINNGNIGINTAIPSERLEVSGSALVSGNVGIGSTLPYKLNVDGDSSILGSLGLGLDFTAGHTFGADTIVLKENNLRIFIDDTSTTSAFPLNDWRLVFNDQGDGGASFFGVEDVTASLYTLFLEAASGNLGIGHTRPNAILHLGDTFPSIIFDVASTTDTDYWLGVMEDAGGDDDDVFVIGDGTAPGVNSFFAINTSGNVGIGTTAPNNLLDIHSDSATAGLAITSLGTDTDPYIKFELTDDTPDFIMGIDDSLTGSDADSFNMRAGTTIAAGTGLTLTPDNELGIGTIPAFSRLHVDNSDTSANVLTVIRVSRADTDSVGADGLGGRITYALEKSDSSSTPSAHIASVWETVDTESSLRFDTYRGGGIQESMRIDDGGNVGIGSAAPEGLLEVQGAEATDAELFLDADDGDDNADTWIIRSTAVDNDLDILNHTSELVTIQNDGNVGIGTTAPGALLEVAGSVEADISDNLTEDGAVCITSENVFSDETDGVCDASSEKVKDDIRDIEYGLDTVMQLRPVTFRYKEDFKPDFQIHRAGFIAEEVHLIVPEVVTYDSYDENGLVDGDPDGIDYGKLTAVLTAGLQELNAKVENMTPGAGYDGDDTSGELFDKIQDTYDEFKDFVSALGMSAEVDEDGNELLTVSSDLAVLGNATMTNATITNTLAVGLVQIDSLENSINVLGSDTTLNLQGDSLLVNSDGNVIVKGTIKADKYLVNTQDDDVEGASAGKAVIKAGELAITQASNVLTSDSLIFVTPQIPVKIGAKVIDDNEFEMRLSTEHAEDIIVSWWIIN
jgi:hypothetical protein